MYVKTPLNYTGGKYKLLPQILPLFPKEIECFYDVFSGGLDVSVNVEAKRKIANDKLTPIIEVMEWFKSVGYEEVVRLVEETEREYGLDFSTNNLSKYNKEKYFAFREEYNKNKSPLGLYVLICNSFSNQVRFNSKGNFNMPCGKRHFNPAIKGRLKEFIDKLENIEFMSKNFRDIDFDVVGKNDFVYCDPPYTITEAAYNKNGGGWSTGDDLYLFEVLDKLNERGIKFAMSNAVSTKGVENKELIEWGRKYNVHQLNMDYGNCNYHRKSNEKTDEVLITNY